MKKYTVVSIGQETIGDNCKTGWMLGKCTHGRNNDALEQRKFGKSAAL